MFNFWGQSNALAINLNRFLIQNYIQCFHNIGVQISTQLMNQAANIVLSPSCVALQEWKASCL